MLRDFVAQVAFRLSTSSVVADLGEKLLVLSDHTSHFSSKSTCVPSSIDITLRTVLCEISLEELKHRGDAIILMLCCRSLKKSLLS